MSNYRFNSIVSTSEQDALKEMIFKRARERAQALNEDLQNTYTSNMQNDIMDLARESFVANKNPFSQIKTEEKSPTEKKEEEIGFARRQVKEIKSQISNNNKNSSTKIADIEVESAMLNARQDFSKKTSFVGALNFLNSQASISLVKNKGKSFEAIA